jgi:hypothetical protein
MRSDATVSSNGLTIPKAQTKDFFEEVGYRNGYTDGATAVVRAVFSKLPAREQASLADLMAQLKNWRGPIGAMALEESIDFRTPPELKEL